MRMLDQFPPDPANLGATHRYQLRADFRARVAAGEAMPLVIPYFLVGIFVLPTLYLAVPHAGRPWLRRARWLVLAAVGWFGYHAVAERGLASTNMACAYAAGLGAGWSVLWTARCLIWSDVQAEAERVERRRRAPGRDGMGDGVAAKGGAAGGVGNGSATMARRKENGGPEDTGTNEGAGEHPQRVEEAPDEDVAKALKDGYEYYWQSYPAQAPFLTRLDWAFDMVTAWRGSGWNFAIPVIPHFAPPRRPHTGELVDLSSMPARTRAGYGRHRTRRGFVRAKAAGLALGYAALDAVSVLMMKDPYFVLGPEQAARHPLPPFLAALPPWALSVWRSALALAGVYAALASVWTLDQLVRGWLLRGWRGCLGGGGGGARADLWHWPSVFGALAPNVLDRGLAGFWAGAWHQTFRAAFDAPARWLVGRGLVPDPRGGAGAGTGRAALLLVAFAQSAFLHACGSYSTLPAHAWPPGPALFFLLQAGGVLAQAGARAAVLGPALGAAAAVPPPFARRAANLLFVLAFLHATCWAFVDDLGRCAIWLFEPVPASPLRAAGLGRPGDGWWRWDRDHFPSWHRGRNWWESGLGF